MFNLGTRSINRLFRANFGSNVVRKCFLEVEGDIEIRGKRKLFSEEAVTKC